MSSFRKIKKKGVVFITRDMDSRTWTTCILVFISLTYIVALAAIIHICKLETVAFIFALIPLIIIIAGVWGYGLKAKFPGGELEYYPVENLMQPAHTISSDKTVTDAEKLMDRTGVDFLNVVDRMGRLIGIFTRADAHRARRQRRAREKIENFMTPLERVIKARRGERLIDIIERIGKTKHSRLPVIDGEKVIGVIDSVDIQDFLAKLLRGA